MKKLLFGLANGALCLSLSAQSPIITSFSPTSGTIGTTVTISGYNFNPTVSANTVYFGAVRAAVTSANATTLAVVVPVGATYQPITVTTNNLTASANGSFVVTFPLNIAGITLNSFAPKTDFVTGSDPETIISGDFDGDGKIDIATANRNSNSVSILRNTSSSGNILFATKVDYMTGSSPVHVALGDLDGDGKLDIVVANSGGNSISVFKNLSTPGSVAFAPKIDYAGRAGTNSIAIGDLDGDGKPDLAVANTSFPDLLIFRNASAGGTISFNSGGNFFIGSYTNIAITDVDGDGKPDLAGTNSGSTFSVNRNTTVSGTISFAAVVNFATGDNNRTFSIGDMDGDGKPDAAVVSFSSGISLLRNTSNNGTVSFAAKQDYAAGDNPRGLALGDVDGDGKPDIAATNSGGASVSVLKNNSANGTIAFATKVDFPVGLYPYSVVIADMDGDGKPDLSIANHNYTSSTVSVIKNQTDGPNIVSYTPTNAASGANITITGSNFTGATSVIIGGTAVTGFTVDSDTQITAVVPTVTGGSVVVTTPNGSASLGGFYNGPTITSVSPTTGPVGTSITISGNNLNPIATNNIVYVGAVKAAVSTASATALTVTVPTGLTYQPISVTNSNRTAYSAQSFATTFASNVTGITPNSFAAKIDLNVNNGSYGSFISDLDGDGKPEMISYNNIYSSIFIYRNTGAFGTISFANSIILTATGVASIALGDADGDGKTDIFASNYSAGTVAVFKNTSTSGNISFAARVDVATPGTSSDIAITDIDGDGKPDLAIVQSGSSIVSLFRNTSSGGTISFSGKKDVSINSVTKIALGDLDGDTKPELVVANYYAASVSILKNTSIPGVLSFAAQVNYPVGASPSEAVAISDLNGDGKPEIAVSNSGSASVSVLRNTSTAGAPSLGAAINYTTANGPAVISVADIDGDGKPDLAISNNTSYSVSILRNTGTMGNISFGTKVDLTTGSNISHVATGDLDGDGRPDLAITNADQGTLSILRNQTAGTDIFSFTPSNAAVGASVIINGINLTGATAVSFGGIAGSSFIINSDGQITATVAAVAGGKVSVTTPKGTATLNGFYNGPVIGSFSPVSGTVGTNVTINGSNFSATPANNTVYFGAVKAVVSAATSTSLTVTVPAGATYQLLTVTTGSLTAYSAKPFAVTFPANVSAFSASSFAPKVDFPCGTNPAHIAVGDLDGDGKAEMITANYGTNTFSIYKNGSSVATIAFAAKQEFGTGYSVSQIAIGDINGDGKPDLAVDVYNSQTIAVFRNTSSGGTISFATELSVYVGIGSQPRNVIISDLDGDGKPDMAVANSVGPLAIFRNTGTVSTIAFAPKQEIAAAGGSPYSLAAGDFDGDGKPDLAVANYTFGSFVIILSVFKNVSTIGTILFDNKKDFITGSDNRSVGVGDLDGDGKMDLVITNKNENNVSLLRNTSIGGVISFAGKVDIATGTGPYSVSIGDIDGDEKQDLAVANSGASTVSILKNNSTPGSLSFSAKQDYTTGNTPYSVAIADLDGDGKPDMALANYNASTVSVLRNLIGAPAINSFTPTNAAVGATVTLTGNGFTGTTAVSFGGVAASAFTVVSDSVITAVVAAVSGGNVIVTTLTGTGLLNGFYNGPVITSFTPASGVIGTAVTITGSNFNATPAANVVYFGAVKAMVTAASATSLTAVVPAGTTYQPISVTTSNLTAYSTKPFGVTFPAPASGFTQTSFAAKADFTTGTNPNGVCLKDLDGDGKPDMAVANSNSNTISVFRNLSNGGIPSFASKVDYATGSSPVGVLSADLDGDGKPELVVSNSSSTTFSVFKNTSSGGVISFATKTDFGAGVIILSIAAADLNADGKPDLVVSNINANSISVFKNTTTGGIISFASLQEFATGNFPYTIAIGDLDGDGKPDLAVTNANNYSVSVLRNIATSGNISFAAKMDYLTTGYALGVAIGDLDGDEKPDLAVTSYNANTLSVFKNLSTAGALSFAAKLDFATGSNPRGIAISDLDGDGKPDLAVGNYDAATVSVFKNGSSNGALSFAAKVDYAAGTSPGTLAIGDLDGDGRPDLVSANYGSAKVSVFKNQLAVPELCAGGSISYTSNISGTNYQWQVNTGSGFAVISNNANYTGTSTATLQLTNLPSAWYGYQYRCVVDGVNSNVFILEFKNYWTGAINNAWEVVGNWSCGVVPDVNTDVMINTGTVFVNSMATCRSLKLGVGVAMTVGAGWGISVSK